MSAWVIALGAFAMLAVIWNRNKPKLLWYIKPVLALIGAGAFAQTSWGVTVSGWMLNAAGWLRGVLGIGPTVLLGIVVVAMFLYVLLELGAEKRANSGVLIAVIALPLLAGVASGQIATAVRTGYDNAAGAGGTAVTRLVGG
jgi:hypothetical protein